MNVSINLAIRDMLFPWSATIAKGSQDERYAGETFFVYVVYCLNE